MLRISGAFLYFHTIVPTLLHPAITNYNFHTIRRSLVEKFVATCSTEFKTLLFEESTDMAMFQRKDIPENNLFNVPYYGSFKNNMLFLGQHPYQTKLSGIFHRTLLICTYASVTILQSVQLSEAIIARDIDASMESIPVIVTEITCMIKLLNHIVNKGKFDKMFDIMKEEWDMLNLDEREVLDKITKRGSKLTNIYRSTLFSFSMIFALFPLLPSVLDVVSPLNETRPLQQVIKFDYVFDVNQHFVPLYLYTVWITFVTMLIIISIDGLYVLIVHHTCGLFAVCGYQIKKAAERKGTQKNGNSTDEFRKCVMVHARALKSYDIINGITSRSYFFQAGLNMINISVTSVQTVMYLHQPEEMSRIACFLIAQQLHLLIISIPGQILMDQSTELANSVYNSIWYEIPVKIQKILHLMQIRSGKPCKMVAGGLYEMSIQNFGITFKTCVSYCTMLLSLKG